MKKFLRCSSLVAMALALAACGGGGNSDDTGKKEETNEFSATIWVSEITGVKELTQKQIDKWNESNGTYKINATIEGISEADSGSQMLLDVESGADLYCFAQDQMTRLVSGGALAKLGKAAAEKVTKENAGGSVAGATIGDSLYAYPITADNGYFMYYDKSVVSEDHLNNLEAIVADCEAAKRYFAMQNDDNAWYLASWFFGAGCVSEWTVNNDSKFTAYNDDWNSDAGVIAMKGMQHLVKSSYYLNSAEAGAFNASTKAAVLVSGTWAGNDVEGYLGENYGCAKLPSYTVDGKTYQMGSYAGMKYMGVKPQKDSTKAAALQSLALYLSSEECQIERFNEFKWGPSNLVAQQIDAVKENKALAALLDQSSYAVAQGPIPDAWWQFAQVLGTVAKKSEANDESAFKEALASYEKSLAGQING